MKKTIKLILMSCSLLILAVLVTACAHGGSPYGKYNKNGYTVSVKFDANGGVFATNTAVRVDTYDISKYTANDAGKKEIQLFDPNDEVRDDQRYAAYLDENHYLLGWYTERTEVSDGNGGTKYSYSGWWDFENDKLELDADKEYNAEDPVITLYAAWVPKLTYEFYTVDKDGSIEALGTPIVLDGAPDDGLKLPALNAETGKIGDANDFPSLDGKTYDKIYADPELKTEIKGERVTHSATFDKETATVIDPVMKIYCTTIDGLWFEVDSPDKIIKNAYPNANFILKSDLDFEGKFWPTGLQTANFTGSLNGNGHTIKNVTVTQSNVNATNFGLFGQLTEAVSFKDVTFDNVKIKITAGSKQNAANFGILAGTISESADISGVVLKNSTLEITADEKKMFVPKPTYGLVSGYGSLEGIEWSENNNVTFDNETHNYEYTIDGDGRFVLTKKTA